MIIGIPQSILILVLVGIFYCMDTMYIHKFDQVREGEGSGRSRSYTALVACMVGVLVLQPALLPQFSFVVNGGWGLAIQALGLLLIVGAMGLHIWSRQHLQQFYAERVEIQPHHRLIDSGPYRTIRHPVITSFFLFATGLFMLNPSIPSLLVVGFTFWDFSRAARAEELLLSESLPGYKEYMTRTWAFFPWIKKVEGENQREH